MSGVWVYLTRPNSKSWADTPLVIPIIQARPVSLGTLIFNQSWRKAADPVWHLETIGM